MQTKKFLLKSALAIAFTFTLGSTAFAACRTETKFNEFTRTWSTNNVCDFGTAPVNNTWSFNSAPAYNYALAYVAPTYVAPVYVAPVVDSWWSFPTWVSEPVYAVPAAQTIDIVAPVTYDNGGWFNNWNTAWVDGFTNYCGDFFEEW